MKLLKTSLLTGWLALSLGCSPFNARCATFDEEDFKEAKKQAEKGDPEAELALGIMYDSGQGVPQNFGEALNWYRSAAAHGNPTAQNNLGIMYLKGRGVPRNPLEGAKWVRMSANQGHPKGQLNLGFLYVEGNGVARNFSEALVWFRKAAEQGDAEAERNLGNILAKGEIARSDYVEAYKWLSLAAAQGDDEAVTERDQLTQKMTPYQIAQGQRLAAAFTPRQQPGEVNLPKASGTGFFVTKHGYLVTAYHVVETASRIVIRTKQVTFAAQVVRTDKTNDIAILKVTGAFPPSAATNRMDVPVQTARTDTPRLLKVADNFRPLPVADSDAARLGDPVSTIGFPNTRIQGSEPKFTRGEINSLAGAKDDPHYFQISSPVQPGNSGGPLFDRFGNVIGLVQLRLNDLTLLMATGSVPQNVNYALKSSYLIDFLRSVPGVSGNLIGPRGEDEESRKSDWVSEAQQSIAVVEVF